METHQSRCRPSDSLVNCAKTFQLFHLGKSAELKHAFTTFDRLSHLFSAILLFDNTAKSNFTYGQILYDFYFYTFGTCLCFLTCRRACTGPKRVFITDCRTIAAESAALSWSREGLAVKKQIQLTFLVSFRTILLLL